MDFKDYSVQGMVDRIRTIEEVNTMRPWPGKSGEAVCKYPNIIALMECGMNGEWGLESFARKLYTTPQIVLNIIENGSTILDGEFGRFDWLLEVENGFYSNPHLVTVHDAFQGDDVVSPDSAMQGMCERYEWCIDKGETFWMNVQAIYRAMKDGVNVSYAAFCMCNEHVLRHERAVRQIENERKRRQRAAMTA